MNISKSKCFDLLVHTREKLLVFKKFERLICSIAHLFIMLSDAQNLPGPYWSYRWPPQHVYIGPTAAWQQRRKVSPFSPSVSIFYLLIFPKISDFVECHFYFCIALKMLNVNSIPQCLFRMLRRHLSLSMISKLLDGSCTYKPTEKEIQVICLLCFLQMFLTIATRKCLPFPIYMFSAMHSFLNSGHIYPVCNPPPFCKGCWTPPAGASKTTKTRTSLINRWPYD